jgi:hypothetical protein
MIVVQNAGLTTRSNFDAIRDEITGALDAAGVGAAQLYALGDYLAVQIWESPEDYGGCDDDPPLPDDGVYTDDDDGDDGDGYYVGPDYEKD